MGNPKDKPMSLRRDPGRDMRDSIHNPQLAAQTQVGGRPTDDRHIGDGRIQEGHD